MVSSQNGDEDEFTKAFPLPSTRDQGKLQNIPDEIETEVQEAIKQKGEGNYIHYRRPKGMSLNNGDNLNISRNLYKKKGEALDKEKKGRCAIEGGCKLPSLAADHHCHRSRAILHNLCVQEAALQSRDNELDLYCSLVSKATED